MLFELSTAPALGLEQATKIGPVERLMFAADHVLSGIILAGDPRSVLPKAARAYRSIDWGRRVVREVMTTDVLTVDGFPARRGGGRERDIRIISMSDIVGRLLD